MSAERSSMSVLHSLTVGPIVLVDEQEPDLSHRLLQELKETGRKVLRITREPPERLRLQFPSGRSEHYWLATEGNGRTLSPFELQGIADLVGRFLRKNPNAVVSIEGIEFLMIMNGYPEVRAFLRQLRQVLLADGGGCIIPIDVRILTARELKELRDTFPMIRGAVGTGYSSTMLFRSMKASSLASNARSSRERSRTP